MERVSRRKLLAAGSGAALASTLVGATTVAAQGRSTRPPGQPLLERIERFVLVTNNPGSDALRQPSSPTQAPTGPVYFTGALWDDGAVGADGTPAGDAIQRGVYRSFGWVYTPGVVPLFTAVHTFDLFGRGQLTAAGVTDASTAITGGTGEFQGARGEIRYAVLNPAGTALLLEMDVVAPNIGR